MEDRCTQSRISYKSEVGAIKDWSAKKVIVYHILDLDRPFVQLELVELTNLSQQLISHHLRTLVRDGYLEKTGGNKGKYVIIDRSEMLGLLVTLGKRTVYPKPKYKHIPPNLVSTIDEVRGMRSLSLGPWQELQDETLTEIKERIEELEAAKKFLQRSTPEESLARKFFGQQNDAVGYCWAALWDNHKVIRDRFSLIQWTEECKALGIKGTE